MYILFGKSEHLGVDGRIILKWTLKRYGVRVCTWVMCLPTGFSGGVFVNTVMKCEFLDQLLTRDFVAFER